MLNKQKELVTRLSDKELLRQLYLTQLIMLVLASSLGFFLFPDLHSFLALWNLADMRIITYGAATAVLVICIDFAAMHIFPEHMLDDGGINQRVFAKRSVPHLLLLTLTISFTEEILFRGIIQTNFGLWASSILFAILHFRYLEKAVLFIMVVGVSFLLGLVYQWTDNLFAPVAAHFMIDFVLALYIRFQYVRRDLYDNHVKSGEKKTE
ncbi:type II CAAX endopeptidase family protein [Bacillus gobiensis]|uniref:CPBP family intramembrane glutamic endopeptidase n=1 Tax=Bacillus gobiensis TaxID=1441095 RepID=UPI003D255D4F